MPWSADPSAEKRFSIAELERVVNAANSSAFFVAARVMRRVVKFDQDLKGLSLDAPHSKCYVIAGERLNEVLDLDELQPRPEHMPETAILIARPDEEHLATITQDEALVQSWRMLFHARVHQVFDQQLADGTLTRADIFRRIEDLGRTQFHEARAVLRQEKLLLAQFDDVATYVEFAAYFLELRFFARSALSYHFPAIKDLEAVESLLNADVNAKELLDECRPEGAPDPEELAVRLFGGLTVDDLEHEPEPKSQRRFLRLTREARQAAARGNIVKAAILRMRASELTSPSRAEQTRGNARKNIAALVERMQLALGFDDQEARQWRGTLWALLEHCSRGLLTAEARLLYDLQKVCIDREREIFKVDLVSWCLSLGKRSIHRPLPNQREVLVCKHLRKAASRSNVVRIAPQQRRQLTRLLEHASSLAETNLRKHLRPRLSRALNSAGVKASNLPERVARRKLIEELIDCIVHRGFFTVGDLRDAISRNNLKVPDLASMDEFLRGDQMLRANRQLDRSLDSVYQPAEIYRRIFQRFSSVFFGTILGRIVTRFLLVPFLGAFVILEGLAYLFQHIAPKSEWVWQMSGMFWADWLPPHKVGHVTQAPAMYAVFMSVLVALALLILGLANSERFRARFARCGRAVGRGIAHGTKWVASITRLPRIRRLLSSVGWRMFVSIIIRPALVTLALWGWMVVWKIWGYDNLFIVAAIFLLTNVVLNTRLGRDMEEVSKDWAMSGWRRFRTQVLPQLFQAIIDLFKSFLEAVDRCLYVVDEQLRFRTGEGGVALVVKGILGTIWFAITYVIRFCVNVLIEPQINPIKHFPTVTVAHKLLLPTIPIVGAWLAPLVGGKATGIGIATAIVTSIPGLFGFLVWELKENWKLYAANRAKRLRPCIVGAHGETMRRFLKPGIHSGTLPKVFKKLRRAELNAQWTGERRKARKYLHKLAEVRHEVEHFVRRELVELLVRSPLWPYDLTVGEVRLSSHCIQVDLVCLELDSAPLCLSFEIQSRWLIASIPNAGWVDVLDSQHRQVLRNAIVGLFKFAGVDLLRRQIDSCFEPHDVNWDIRGEKLVVRVDSRGEILYGLESSPLEPDVRGDVAIDPPTVHANEIFFSHQRLLWASWLETWDANDLVTVPNLLESASILPAPPPRIATPAESA